MSSPAQRSRRHGRGVAPTSEHAHFWAPRYWTTWLFLAWLWLAARLPQRAMIRLHKSIGRLMGRLLRGQSRIARRNLELCFPDSSDAQRAHLLSEHFAALGACIGETGVAWFGRWEHILSLGHVTGREHVTRAFAAGKGVILFTGHFTGLEICGPMLKSAVPNSAFMFSYRSNALLDRMQARGRARSTDESFAAEDVRGLLRALQRNMAVWYAPDRAYHGPRSQLVPFFGEPAMTHTSTSRIARISGAAVVPYSYRRLPDDSGYVLEFLPALEDFPTDDDDADTRRLVAVLEDLIRRCPEQYLWTHKRFRGRPAPWPDVYGRG
jgi:KDO2-lipid IV(A) lauroyltransferase